MKKIRKHIAGIIILSLVMVMGTKTFTAETKKNGNPAYATVTYKVTNKSTKESAKFKGQFKIKTNGDVIWFSDSKISIVNTHAWNFLIITMLSDINRK